MNRQPIRAVRYTGQAPGAWPKGATVRKINSQPDDASPDGTLGQIIGSLDVREAGKPATYAYFIAWAHSPDLAVACVDTNNDGTPRLELAT